MQNIEQTINPEDQALLDALADIPDGAEVVMANAPHINITDQQRQVAFIDVTPVMMISITGRLPRRLRAHERKRRERIIQHLSGVLVV